MHQVYSLLHKIKVAYVVQLCALIHRDEIFIQLSSPAFPPELKGMMHT